MHGGFTNRVCDFDWNQNEDNLMVAAAEDNQIQTFIPSDKLILPEAVNEDPEVTMQDVEA
jgi:histone-binding protein RBBP4